MVDKRGFVKKQIFMTIIQDAQDLRLLFWFMESSGNGLNIKRSKMFTKASFDALEILQWLK